MSNLFQEPTAKVPENDPRITRVGFEQVIPGATKRHMPKIAKRTDMSIVHVKGAGAT